MVTPGQFEELVASRRIDARIDAHDTIQVPLAQLERFVELTEELGLVILGLDGLRQDGAVIVPLIDYIADFGEIGGPWDDRVRASAVEARSVAAGWESGPDLVEVVLEGLDE